MTQELGVVCGECDAYSPMGTVRCVCGHDLVLYRESVLSVRPPPHVPTAAPGAMPDIPRAPAVPRRDARREDTLPPSASFQSRSAAPIAPEAAVGPMSERRSGLRPQAPEVLPPRPAERAVKSGPRIEVIEGPPSQRAKGQADSSAPESTTQLEPKWGNDTTGKIPLRAPRTPAATSPRGGTKGRSKEELMEQARNYVCRSCSTPVPSGHKFCGRCGAAVPPDILSLREEYYGSLQIPGRAKLILIRAEGDAAMEGLSFALNAQEHIVGRQGHLTFPEDRFVSPKHANLYYRDGTLVVRDEGSLNGVYVRVRGTIEVQASDMFLAGEEVFRIDATPKATDHPEADGTYFWSSPKRPSPFRIAQVLQGGATGNVVCARETGVAIGREGGDMNFPSDVYMSATHAKVEADAAGKLTLTDLGSRNGTYVRLRGERDLAHGDYIFIGKKILRVEVTG